MEVKIEHTESGVCHYLCMLYRERDLQPYCKAKCEDPKSTIWKCYPGPDCPGPGTYELRKVVDDG